MHDSFDILPVTLNLFQVAFLPSLHIARLNRPKTSEKSFGKMSKFNAAQQGLGVNGAATTMIFDIGSEPDFATLYLYICHVSACRFRETRRVGILTYLVMACRETLTLAL